MAADRLCYPGARSSTAATPTPSVRASLVSGRCVSLSNSMSRMAVFQWLEGWYNPHRRHSSLGYLSPINYERRQLQQSA